jgi:hypothetical protein
LHYFKQTKKMRDDGTNPSCAECGADLVDWQEVWARDLSRIDETFKNLKYEFIRHYYWHRNIDDRAVNYAKRKGKINLMATVEKRIRSSVSKPADSFDGRQTDWNGNPIFYAQHATATCCRRCIEKWHNIPRDRELTKSEIQYFTELARRYLGDRFGDLPDEGQKVPVLRRRKTREY